MPDVDEAAASLSPLQTFVLAVKDDPDRIYIRESCGSLRFTICRGDWMLIKPVYAISRIGGPVGGAEGKRQVCMACGRWDQAVRVWVREQSVLT